MFFCLVLKKRITLRFVHADIELINGDDWSDFRRKRITESEVRRMTVNMNVDSGALMMAINENIQGQLGLEIVEVRRAQLADGTFIELPVTSPIEVRFANRRCTTQAVVLPESTQPLLGAIPIKDMDVLIHPEKQELVVHPDHPHMAQVAMRGFR